MTSPLASDKVYAFVRVTSYACVITSSVALFSQIPLFASGAIGPNTRAHSAAVEVLDALSFFSWLAFALGVYRLLAATTSEITRWGLALGIAGALSLTILHVLFAFEVLWFVDSIMLFLLCVIAWVTGLLSLVHATPGRARNTHGMGVLDGLLAAMAILVYPLWALFLWRRISAAKHELEGSYAW